MRTVDALADDGQPAQPDQRVQPQPLALPEVGRVAGP